MITKQSCEWATKFGREYTERNPQSLKELDALYFRNYGRTWRQISEPFLESIDTGLPVLEVGCGIGLQLLNLKELGFWRLYGVEIQPYAVEMSKQTSSGLSIIQGNGADLPFKDNFFGLVFTKGFMIHSAPGNINSFLEEIFRCTNRYIWGLEYYAETITEVPYRGLNKMLWKADYPRLFLNKFPKCLELVKKELIYYQDSGNVDCMYLLEKTQ